MKNISVLKDTNKLVSSSEDNLSGVREGSFIKVGQDDIIYIIAKINKVFLNKNFDIQTSRNIVINDNTNIKLQKNDTIKISYQEYELNNILDIKNGGRLYILNDIINIKGGEPIVDIHNGLSNLTQLIVEKTNEVGGAIELGLKNNGRYIVPPNNPCQTFSEHGEECLLNLDYKITDSKTVIERKIQDININEDKTYITLNYPISDKIINGKLSTEKWEITLSSNYVGESKINVNYEIYKDFTPYLHLPLLVKGSQSTELIYNKGMILLEDEIKKIKRHLRM